MLTRDTKIAGSRLSLIFAYLCVMLTSTALAQEGDVEFGVLHVQGGVYMLYGGDAGNITMQVGEDGVFLVNALREGLADSIVAAIETVTPAPIRYIVSTSADLHNTGGNAELAGRGMFGSTPTAGRDRATLVAHENVMLRLSSQMQQRRNPFPGLGIPQNAYILPFKDIYFNGEPIFVMHEPNAHSDGDSIVLFRKSDAIAVGDLFTPNRYPIIDVENGGTVNGLLRSLNHLLDLAVPANLQDGGTRIIPGRGRLCNEADVVEYRNMVAMIRDRVRDAIERGLSLSQAQDERFTSDFDLEYEGSGADFVESVYASLIAEVEQG